MFNDREKAILKRLVVSPEWSVIMKVVNVLLSDIEKRVKLKDNEWDTLKAVIGDEKEAEGIRKVVQIIQKIAQDAK